MSQSTPRAPSELQRNGRKLWREVLQHLVLDEHERALLLEACRTVDQLDALAEAVGREGVMVGDRPHPALVESRQQRVVLARVLASLRLPEDLANPNDSRRPQRRGAARGVYDRPNLKAVQ